MKLTIDRLREVLSYDPTSGSFRWAAKNNRRIVLGAVAGCIGPGGYWQVRIDGVKYYAHRLAWLHAHGELSSTQQIDHINGVRQDNRIENLRMVPPAVNQQNRKTSQRNNKLGLLGVCAVKNGFKAQISVNGQNKYLGYFKTPKEAHERFLAAKRELHEGNTL